MPQRSIPAVFMRGGTSKGVYFHHRDLPADPALRDRVMLQVIGSPDPYGRQLDGMGGGISSLSKVIIVAPPSRPDVDVEFTFGQVAVEKPQIDYRGTCGNLTSGVGPFAIDEGMVKPVNGDAAVRIFNTNTKKIVVARFGIDGGKAAVEGDFELAGVAGKAAPVRLEFLDPGGAGTGKLLPTGAVVDVLDVPGIGKISASLVDATNACVYVRASDLKLSGVVLPTDLEANTAVLEILELIRAIAGVMMGIAATPEEVTARSPSVPKVGIVAPPAPTPLLDGTVLSADTLDLNVRMISMGRPHRAIPLTGAMCVAVAARITGTVVNEAMRPLADPTSDIRVGTASGVLPVAAAVRWDNQWVADHVVVYRTARRLMQGSVLVRESAWA